MNRVNRLVDHLMIALPLAVAGVLIWKIWEWVG
jgi:hypothetical protein